MNYGDNRILYHFKYTREGVERQFFIYGESLIRFVNSHLLKNGGELILAPAELRGDVPDLREYEGTLDVKIEDGSNWETELPPFIKYNTSKGKAVRLLFK